MYESLEKNHYCVIENFVPRETCDSLLTVQRERQDKFKFENAKIGTFHQSQQKEKIRNSQISWIDFSKEKPKLRCYEDYLNELKNDINKNFYLSLKRFESQFATYPIGGFYKKHLDQFKTNTHRQVTAILYLNDVFNGGQLIIYDKDDKQKIAQTIQPKKGTLAIFFSKTVYHEVLSCLEKRHSITTWFRDDLEPFLH